MAVPLDFVWIGIIVLVVWEIVWKGLGMWRSARNGHKIWFWAILIVNSVGIIPIIYLALHPKKKSRRNRK